MREFSQLINQLILTRSRNRKIELLNHYFKNTENPDRGLTLAILTGNLKIKNISISKIKELIKTSFDKGVEWDKKILEKVEKKFNLSPYQSKCANAAIGFILGALIL